MRSSRQRRETSVRFHFSWIDLPSLGSEGPAHHRGIVESEPGLYFLGLKFLYSVSLEQIHGVGRDAAHIADDTASRPGKSHSSGPARNQDQPQPVRTQGSS